MLKNHKLIILLMVLFTVSCASNKELVTYQFEGKTQKLSLGQALKDIRTLYQDVSPMDISNFVQSDEILKLVVFGRLIEPQLIIKKTLEITNFQEDPMYQSRIDSQKKILPYQIAFQNGEKSIKETIQKQSVEVAEVSRIVITNGDPLILDQNNDVSLNTILKQILDSEDQLNEFANLAEQYSQESAKTSGGYLGKIYKGQYKEIDVVVFDKKHKGFYTEIISNASGSYLVFVHTQIKKEKVSKLAELDMDIEYELTKNYILDNTKLLFDIQQQESNTIILVNNKELSEDKLNEKLPIVSFWGKKYTVGQLKEVLDVILGNNPFAVYTPKNIMLLLKDQQQSLTEQLAIVFKGYNAGIKNSKTYKDLLAKNLESLELESAYTIMSSEVFKDISTNVSAEEVKAYYDDTNTRPIQSYKDDGTPVYASLKEAGDQIKQKILSQRIQQTQNIFRSKLADDNKVLWNDMNMQTFASTIEKDYASFLKKNPNAGQPQFNFQ